MSNRSNSIRQTLDALLRKEDLSREDAGALMSVIMDGDLSDVQISGVLVALRAKGETVDEIAGFVSVMRERALKVETTRTGAVDTCGTGGDGAQTFNISTAAALVAAGAGVTIAKHGNRALSSQCGSSDVLEALGVATVHPQSVGEIIDRVGIGFMFAPLHHPATRHAAQARRDLGVRTVFNLLGPMTNPALVRRQLIGVFDPALTETVARVLSTLGSEKVFVVHGDDGSDEVSVIAKTRVTKLDGGVIETSTFAPEDVGISRHRREDIAGGTPAENAEMIRSVLDGSKGPRRDAVIVNAGFVICVAGKAATVQEGVDEATAAIDSGRARDVLESLQTVSAQFAAG